MATAKISPIFLDWTLKPDRAWVQVGEESEGKECEVRPRKAPEKRNKCKATTQGKKKRTPY